MNAAQLAANRPAFLAACALRPRADLLTELAIYAGPAGVAAVERYTDEQIASILWSLRGMALCRAAA